MLLSLGLYWTAWDRLYAGLKLGRAPRTKETLPDFLKWRRVTRPPLIFRGLTGSQQTPGFWGVTNFKEDFRIIALESGPTVHLGGGPMTVQKNYPAIRLGG